MHTLPSAAAMRQAPVHQGRHAACAWSMRCRYAPHSMWCVYGNCRSAHQVRAMHSLAAWTNRRNHNRVPSSPAAVFAACSTHADTGISMAWPQQQYSVGRNANCSETRILATPGNRARLVKHGKAAQGVRSQQWPKVCLQGGRVAGNVHHVGKLWQQRLRGRVKPRSRGVHLH